MKNNFQSIIKIFLLTAIFSPFMLLAQSLYEKKVLEIPDCTNSFNDTIINIQEVNFTAKQNYPGFLSMIKDVPRDFIEFGALSFKKENLFPILFLSSATALLMKYDERTWKETKKFFNKSKSLNSFTDNFVYVGDAKWHLGLSGAALLFGYLSGDRQLQNTAFQTAEAVIASGLFVQLLKRISGRESPAVYTKPGGYWDLFPDLGEYQHRQPEYYAFPSGHITSATAFFTVISGNYPELKWIKPVSYGLICLLGISLVNHDMHWYSDLPLGIAIGYAFGKIISNRYSFGNFQNDDKNFSITPSMMNGSYTVFLSYKF